MMCTRDKEHTNMKRALLLPLALLALSSTAAPPVGSSWKDVKVTDLTIYTAAGAAAGKGYVVVTFSSSGTGTPSCASAYPRNVVIDPTPAADDRAVATVEVVMMTGTTVTVTGTGSCSIIPSMETMASIQTTAR
jgi:hypothetical protein